ncbi:MAG: SDR family oxidoreductase [Gemmatimonadales bacterium]|nr:SDR family oxidoreductase [Gemmatimonadales bacterium]NCG32370.1 SDR family NAD(P)-dependent oxidoreductase [Pseudomonadota bacterium]MBT3500003.1 SDR family oxidoreductase [Gemmatimonadales bacterium]MBT3774843.1 SDR family oxidoreductase [Gemmatimonadales bacterium]MBT3957962.1 SDR family oxidoreductase [Gemmatimonadales bacterium]
MSALEGKSVVLTGAAQGLGAAIARHFHELGAGLILLDRDGEGLAETCAACPGATSAVVDLSDVGDTERAIAAVVTGPIDTLIHNAAILRVEPLETVSLGTFQATLNVGIQAAFQLTQAVWPHMKKQGGALVYVSSRSGVEGFANETAYCAGKHALEGFSKCLALEGEPHGILSVTITPGMYIHTPMSETTYPPELREKWVDPIVLAPAFSYLASRPMHLSGQRLDAWVLTQQELTT